MIITFLTCTCTHPAWHSLRYSFPTLAFVAKSVTISRYRLVFSDEYVYVVYVVECATNCKRCDVEGAGKCDAGQCNDVFYRDPTLKTCAGEYSLFCFV